MRPATLDKLRGQLRRPAEAHGDTLVTDLSPEDLKLWLLALPVGATYRHDILKAVRQALAWAERAKLITTNPARLVTLSKPHRSEKILPFETWAQVDLVASEAGRWAPLIEFMVDCGARPQEIVALEHRHVDARAGRVLLPGVKSANAMRTVHLTPRGIDAYQRVPRNLATPLVFHGQRSADPLNFQHWRHDVWRIALDLAGLAYRPPYSMRHTFAVWSLQAGVPIGTLAREMGHSDVSVTHRTYGAWRVDMGERAATLRTAWATENAADGTIVEPLPGGMA